MTALKKIVCGWLHRIVSLPGWHRWLALAAAAFLFMLSVLWLSQRTDYREDPSALAPRSADLYAETRDLPGLLKTAGAWKLWRGDRRGATPDARSALERDFAALVSARMGGLPVNPPLRWMETSQGAAWSVSRNDSGDGAGTESWALYLKLDEPEAALKEIEVEPGMKLETAQGERGGDGVFILTGQGGSTAHIGVVGPWLILSGDAKLPEFALAAKRSPGVSLAGAGILPQWRREAGLRGLFNPSYTAPAALSRSLGAVIVSEWLSPAARIAYSASLGRNGGVETAFNTVELSAETPGAGIWPLVYILAALLALVSLCVVLGILLAMIGWGGWLKAMAVKEGVAPAEAPENVTPSAAFTEDAATPAAVPEEKSAKIVSEPEAAGDTQKSDA